MVVQVTTTTFGLTVDEKHLVRVSDYWFVLGRVADGDSTMVYKSDNSLKNVTSFAGTNLSSLIGLGTYRTGTLGHHDGTLYVARMVGGGSLTAHITKNNDPVNSIGDANSWHDIEGGTNRYSSVTVTSDYFRIKYVGKWETDGVCFLAGWVENSTLRTYYYDGSWHEAVVGTLYHRFGGVTVYNNKMYVSSTRGAGSVPTAVALVVGSDYKTLDFETSYDPGYTSYCSRPIVDDNGDIWIAFSSTAGGDIKILKYSGSFSVYQTISDGGSYLFPYLERDGAGNIYLGARDGSNDYIWKMEPGSTFQNKTLVYNNGTATVAFEYDTPTASDIMGYLVKDATDTYAYWDYYDVEPLSLGPNFNNFIGFINGPRGCK